MGRFIVIVLDGFGVGFMEDAKKVRPEDVGANTLKHIASQTRDLKLPNLCKLGLMSSLGEEIGFLKFNENATYGSSNLAHFGADTFMGHQEIMGTKPEMPFKEPFNNIIDDVEKELTNQGFHVNRKSGTQGDILVVNDALAIGDNIEADLGQAYNITSALDIINYSQVIEIGRIVRNIAKVSRVIAFGGESITLQNILDAIEEKENGFVGINAPKAGVYNKGYQCIHLGYGVDSKVQAPVILGGKGIDVTLIGKVADVIENPYGKSLSIVDTTGAFELTLQELNSMKQGFICTNIQETDLCGHRQSVKDYVEKLIISDQYIGKIMDVISDDDILLIMADHGNDPTIGHSRHTRERVPLLIYGKKIIPATVGIRKTLADVGATVMHYFGEEREMWGTSFLSEIL